MTRYSTKRPRTSLMRGVIKLASASKVVFLSVTISSSAADIARGNKLSELWCTGCHAVVETRSPAMMLAPPLEVIAQRQPLDSKVLSQLLQAPHPQMPDRGLSRDEAADIAAYIESLKH